MSAGWVAGSVRAHAIARRRLGLAAARELADSPSLSIAVQSLAASAYGREVTRNASLAQAQHGVAATALWQMRVLAGWLPSTGAQALRVLAGGFEIANVEQHMRALAGQEAATTPYRLGALATAWRRLAATGTAVELRAALAASPWGDPGGDTARDVQLAMRLRWAQRVASRVPAAAGWARGAGAVLVARELFAARRPLPPGATTNARQLFGASVVAVGSLGDLIASLPSDAAAALGDIDEPAALWRVEARWWERLRVEGPAMLARSGFGLDRVVGAVATLAADAWLVRAALELAARGGDAGRLDALA